MYVSMYVYTYMYMLMYTHTIYTCEFIYIQVQNLKTLGTDTSDFRIFQISEWKFFFSVDFKVFLIIYLSLKLTVQVADTAGYRWRQVASTVTN